MLACFLPMACSHCGLCSLCLLYVHEGFVCMLFSVPHTHLIPVGCRRERWGTWSGRYRRTPTVWMLRLGHGPFEAPSAFHLHPTCLLPHTAQDPLTRTSTAYIGYYLRNCPKGRSSGHFDGAVSRVKLPLSRRL